MTVVVDENGQILRTREGFDLTSGGPFLRSQSGRATIARPSFPFNAGGWPLELTLIDGTSVSFTDLYRTQPYVASAVNALARQIARLPLKVYRRKRNGERERQYTGRLVDLLHSPAPRCGPAHLKQWLAVPVLVHGNSVLLKGRQERFGPPTRLWPLDWRYATPKVEGSRIVRWSTNEFGEADRFDPEDVVHLGWEAPDGRIGVSPLQQLGVTIRIEKSAQEYQEGYLRTGARPPSSINMPEGVVLTPELRAEIRSDIANVHGGSGGAGQPALLPGGITWTGVGHTAHEAELIEQRKLTREEVATVYAVPQPLMGLLDHATYSNVAELHRMLYTTVLGPWLTLIEETLQAQVVDPEPAFRNLFVEFDLAEVLKGDTLKEINTLKTAVQSGLLTLNEARQVQNRPAYTGAGMEWCDKPLVPSNNLASAPGDASGDPAGDGGDTPNGNGGGDPAEAEARVAAAVSE